MKQADRNIILAAVYRDIETRDDQETEIWLLEKTIDTLKSTTAVKDARIALQDARIAELETRINEYGERP